MWGKFTHIYGNDACELLLRDMRIRNVPRMQKNRLHFSLVVKTFIVMNNKKEQSQIFTFQLLKQTNYRNINVLFSFVIS